MDKIVELANEILDASLKTLSAEFTYFTYPLGLLDYVVGECDSLVATNGKRAVLDAKKIVEITAEKGVKGVCQGIMHVMLHCLFLHPLKKSSNSKIHDLATDITVGYILDYLGYPSGERVDKERRKAVYKSIIDEFGNVNDQTSAKYCEVLSIDEQDNLYPIFKVCSHDGWHYKSDCKEENKDGVNISFGTLDDGEVDDLKALWGSAIKNLIPKIGKLNPELKRMISVQVGEGGNYKAFLKSFLRRRERVRPSDEEFDYIYYCLGLQNYGNVPLVENLEYSDRRDYSDLVIAVDTSGSTDGEPIVRLLKEMFSLIKSMETESEKYRIRILQCDLKIQREDVVCSQEELTRLLANYTLQGGGGTDFRPVFEYLTTLKRKGEKIEGLIYFTDGVGLYPREVPPFKTCFAIIGDSEGVQVPHFAYKINIED